MRRLVIAAHLPHHRITILVIVPKGVVSPLGFGGRSVNSDIVVGSTHDDLLTPVAKEIALITGCTLCIVIGHRSRQRSYQAFAIFIDTTSRILAIGIVERLIAEVTIPIDTHIISTTRLRQSVDMLIGDTTDGIIMCRESHCTRIVVAEVGSHTTSVIIATSHPVTDL